MHTEESAPVLYGLLAEFDSATAIVEAARKTREAGFTKIDAYTPFPIHELDAALKLPRTRLPWIVLLGGIAGMASGFALQYWASVIEYPLNIGGRPLNSWVAFSIPTYETTILLAALATAGSMLVLNGFPQPYHPVFNVEAFRRTATSTGFFLCIEATDPRFDAARTRAFLEGLHPKAINEVNA